MVTGLKLFLTSVGVVLVERAMKDWTPMTPLDKRAACALGCCTFLPGAPRVDSLVNIGREVGLYEIEMNDKFSRAEQEILRMLSVMGRMPRGELVSALCRRFGWERKRGYAALWFMEKRHLLRRTPKGFEALAVRGVRVAEAFERKELFA